MPQTLLAKKSGPQDNAIATDDEHHEQLASDPAVQQFPQNSSFGAASSPSAFGGGSAFGAPQSGGFGAPSPYSPPASGGFGGGSVGSVPPAPQQNLTQAGSNAAQDAEVLVKHSKESEDWINKKWRPVMGWMYMAVCVCDFTLFPVLWSVLQALSKGNVTTQWQPVTLMGAGLFHVAMGAVLGIAAYGRTKEKLESKQ